MNMKVGDVYAVKTPDDRYVAVRILQGKGKSWVIATTAYLSSSIPIISDPALTMTVIQNRFSYKNQPAITWIDGKPPVAFQYIGNIPPTTEEKSLDCKTYSGTWTERTGNQAFLEWRWVNDRQAFEAEVEKRMAKASRLRRLPKRPKKMMDEKTFWSIIALLDWNKTGDDDNVLAPAVAALAKFSKAEICAFEERFTYHLYQLDTKAHASNIGEYSYTDEKAFFSVDGFLYSRCVVVANGREYFEKVLKNPKHMPKDLEFEAILSLAPSAYEIRTGDAMDYVCGCDYETFSNPDGWK